VLDVGFGRGRLLAQLAMHFPNVDLHGIDDNDESVRRARELVPRAKLEKGKFQSAQGPFDFVVCSQIFEHVADTDALLDKLMAVTKPGGHITFSTPSGWTYRRPRLGNFYHALTEWDFYKRVRLQPEKNWDMALLHHPSTQPSKVMKRFVARGGEIISRRSAMPLIEVNGLLHRFWKLVGGVRGAAMARYTTILLNAAMNVIPGMRIFESQFVLLVRKTP
jgi:SAM-dependent methyltransferase